MATGTPEAWVMDLQVDDFLVLLNTLLVAYSDFLRKLTIPFPEDPPRGAVLRMAARSDGGPALPPAQAAKSEG